MPGENVTPPGDAHSPGVSPRGAPRKAILLRLNPALAEALERWARDELRSVNAQVEYLLADAVRKAGRRRP